MRATNILFLALTVAAAASSALAQCSIPDGLDGGPCCTIADESLPTFPRIETSAIGLCYLDCDVEETRSYLAQLEHPVPPPQAPAGFVCGLYFANLSLYDASTLALEWSGTMWMQYSRTWLETSEDDRSYQVWRFLWNGELDAERSVADTPCPLPTCSPVFNDRVRWTGYVDYALDCDSLEWSHAWLLDHECDAIDHAPGFPRAGTFHPDRSYAFVAPAAGFVPSAAVPVERGSTAVESIRRVNLPIDEEPGSCESEELLVGADLSALQTYCPCGAAGSTAAYAIASADVAGLCGTTASTPGGPYLSGLVSKSLGSWTNAAVFPGVESLRWNCAGYEYSDPCTSVVRDEVFFGVTTRGGYDATELTFEGPGRPLPLVFIDQSSSLRQPQFTVVMNIRYVSDHFIALNLEP